MMFLKESFNIPISLLQIINEKTPFLYKIIMILMYLIIPYGIMYLVDKIKNKGEQKHA
jgi:hypothetical protein